MTQLQLSTLLFLAGVIWFVLLLVNGVAVELTWLKVLPTVASVLFVLVGSYERWLWKLPLIRPLLSKRPVLEGTWRATVRPQGREHLDAFMVVAQTYSSLRMRLLSAEAASEALSGTVAAKKDGGHQIAALYRSTPRLSVRKQSPIHFGAMLLEAHDDPVSVLIGHYWTDRRTMGELELRERHRTHASSFEDASRLFSAAVPGR
ncbi:MAG: hypothetical protein ABSG61_00610 [Gemmatimonadales bacterium]|jgi:hypothetical protein